MTHARSASIVERARRGAVQRVKAALEFRHLRAFVAVAEAEHVTHAASRLRIAQPALTRQIQQLEAAVGVPLLQRVGRGVQLTAAGRAFLDDARALLSQAAAAVVRATDVHRGMSGLLRVGFVEVAAASGLLPAAVRRLSETMPGVRVELHELTTASQIVALQAGDLDVGFACAKSIPPGGRLASFTVLSDPLVAVMPRAHRLATARSLPLAALAGESLLIIRRQLGPALYADVFAALSESGVVPDRVQEVSQFLTIPALAAAGLGIGIVPQSIVAGSPAGTVVHRIAGLRTRHRVQLVHAAQNRSAVMDEFVAACRSLARDMRARA